MKRMGQLMQEIGFNKDGADSVKEAFIKNLIRASEGVNVTTPSEHREIEANKNKVRNHPSKNKKDLLPVQLSFDFDKTGTDES